MPRLYIAFWGGERAERAQRFAKQVTEGSVQAGFGRVLAEGVQRRKRLAVLALRDAGQSLRWTVTK